MDENEVKKMRVYWWPKPTRGLKVYNHLGLDNFSFFAFAENKDEAIELALKNMAEGLKKNDVRIMLAETRCSVWDEPMGMALTDLGGEVASF